MSSTQDGEEATTSPIDVKAIKVAISTFEMGKLNEIAYLLIFGTGK